MLPLSPEPMRSSTGNSIESVEQPWHSAEATNIRLLGAEAADYQMFREGHWRARSFTQG